MSDEDVEARYRQVRERAQNEPTADPLNASDADTPELARQQIRNVLLRERATEGLHRLLQRLSAEAKVSIDFPPPDPPVLQLSDGDDPSLGRCRLLSRSWNMQTSNVPLARRALQFSNNSETCTPIRSVWYIATFRCLRILEASPPPRRRTARTSRENSGPIMTPSSHGCRCRLNTCNSQRISNSIQRPFRRCLSSGRPQAAVSKDIQDARRLGISGTPTFFVNGRYLSGFQTLEALRAAVDRELINAAASNAGSSSSGCPPTMSLARQIITGMLPTLVSVVLAWQAHAGAAYPSVALVDPVSEKGAAGLFNKIVTARGAEIDSAQAGYHMIRAIEATTTFSADTPEIYVVMELKQSAFDMFELIARFILEDPDGKPVGRLLHTDRAHFEFSDTGGYVTMKQPPGGFPVGNYRVEIHYGEQVNEISLLTLVRFKVLPAAATTTAPLPQTP